MATKIIDNNGIVSFDSISSEHDLKLNSLPQNVWAQKLTEFDKEEKLK